MASYLLYSPTSSVKPADDTFYYSIVDKTQFFVRMAFHEEKRQTQNSKNIASALA